MALKNNKLKSFENLRLQTEGFKHGGQQALHNIDVQNKFRRLVKGKKSFDDKVHALRNLTGTELSDMKKERVDAIEFGIVREAIDRKEKLRAGKQPSKESFGLSGFQDGGKIEDKKKPTGGTFQKFKGKRKKGSFVEQAPTKERGLTGNKHKLSLPKISFTRKGRLTKLFRATKSFDGVNVPEGGSLTQSKKLFINQLESRKKFRLSLKQGLINKAN